MPGNGKGSGGKPIEPGPVAFVPTDGNDIFLGTRGVDAVNGLLGDDLLSGDNGNDTLYGDGGTDTLNGGNGTDTLYGGTENDALYGANAVDWLYGDAGDDTLDGGNGNDTLDGGAGIDALYGGRRTDVLVGGLGADLLTGGEGPDQFVFGAPELDTVDTIVDFQAGVDEIRLDGAGFSGLVAASSGELDAASFLTDLANAVVGQAYVYYDTATGGIFYDADGLDGNAAQQFAVLVGIPALTAADFTIV
jgi:Ca2+-binding RTX toxin-like protein